MRPMFTVNFTTVFGLYTLHPDNVLKPATSTVGNASDARATSLFPVTLHLPSDHLPFP